MSTWKENANTDVSRLSVRLTFPAGKKHFYSHLHLHFTFTNIQYTYILSKLDKKRKEEIHFLGCQRKRNRARILEIERKINGSRKVRV